MTESSNKPDFSNDNGIAAIDLLRFFRHSVGWIAGALVVGGVVGYGVSLTIPSQWQANVVVQIGQFDGTPPALIDTLQRTLVRIQSPDFLDQVIKNLGLPVQAHVNRDTDLVRNTLTAQGQPTTDMVQISARGYSPEQARNAVLQAQNLIIEIQRPLVAPTLERLQKRVESLDHDIQIAEQRLIPSPAQLSANQQSGRSPDSRDGTVNQLLDHMLQTDMRRQDINASRFLEDLKQQRAIVQKQIDPANTYNTKPVTSISVSPGPVSPHRSLSAALGAAIGLVLGMVFSLLRYTRMRSH